MFHQDPEDVILHLMKYIKLLEGTIPLFTMASSCCYLLLRIRFHVVYIICTKIVVVDIPKGRPTITMFLGHLHVPPCIRGLEDYNQLTQYYSLISYVACSELFVTTCY